ncbi:MULTISPECIES: CarD family transcriptional regulator [unclassified Corynebacterium]|uniref:CarD family transcriptional regulator n=1 Tax=unclassified Corynebacterium TaxID=2624378 RepID=UPI0021AA36A7|nr:MULTISPECIES: CarD family transcriptional regulator [unclassified Corynebacterium]MCT1452210.1 CarD family transcriptional regulator [Corynebacterium sp. p3-SID1145]MCT1462148.1 CarD family transcriptional regulator [Corynebacterium sp. p3-SID1140]MDN8595040.1 CarD family transcriptional regulator [Corynebacterium sp. P4_F2]WKK55431.1 CarD family transcriptional regulator [Corynebacterium sp. P4-C1]WKK62840.1 CarD family transcriptional regulator [Corynebacterium sp. P8-C1]
MDFTVGEVVVYPHHGAARIADIEKREMGGEELDFLVLNILQSDLSVRVPVKNAELVGVRDVVGEEGLRKVFSVLRETDVEEAGNWSRRYKANQERLASGDINKVAEVVRDLWRRDQGRGLSAGEKRMLGKARQILVGELALAEPVDEKKADGMEKEIQAVIARHVEQGLVEKPREDFDPEDDVDLDDLSFDDDDSED